MPVSLKSSMKPQTKDFIRTGYLCIVLVWMSLCANSQAAAASSVQLNTTYDGQGVCNGETITFTCTTRGSSSHVWINKEYIGPVQLEFSTLNTAGDIKSNPISVSGTKAELLFKNETELILKSQLHISVTSTIPNATITCINVDMGINVTKRFENLVKPTPGPPLDVAAIELPDNSKTDSNCVLLVQPCPPSNTAPVDIMNYIVNYRSGQRMIPSTSGTISVPNCSPDLRVKVMAVNRCGDVGIGTNDIMPSFIEPDADRPNIFIESDADRPISVAAIILGGVVFIIIILFGIFCIIWIFKSMKNTKRDKDLFELKESEYGSHEKEIISGESTTKSSVSDADLNKDHIRALVEKEMQILWSKMQVNQEKDEQMKLLEK